MLFQEESGRQQLGASLNISSPSYAAKWVTLLADDCHLDAGRWGGGGWGRTFDQHPLVFFLLCVVVGCPLSWSKTNGSRVTNWVGFELLLVEHSLGLCERPAAWVMKWARDTAPVNVVHVRSFERGIRQARLRHQSSGTSSAVPRSTVFVHFVFSNGCGASCTSVRCFLPQAHCSVCRAGATQPVRSDVQGRRAGTSCGRIRRRT